MSHDGEIASTAPRQPGRTVFDPAVLSDRTQDDFQVMLAWLGVSGAVALHIHGYLPGEREPRRKESDRNSLSSSPGDFARLSEASQSGLSQAEEEGRRVMSEKELNTVRLSWERSSGSADTQSKIAGGGPVDLAKKMNDPRMRRSDAPVLGLYTRPVSGGARSVYLNVSLFGYPGAIYAAMAHECTHLFLDTHGAQSLRVASGSVRSNLLDLDEERRTDRVAVLLGFGVLMLNGACDFYDKVGSHLLYNELSTIARDHRDFCTKAGLSTAEATRGMTDAARAVFGR